MVVVVFVQHCQSFVFCLAAGEVLGVSEQFLAQRMHPTVIIAAFRQAMDEIVSTAKDELR